MRPRPYSERVRRTRRSSSSASSPGIAKTVKAVRLSGRPGSSWTERWWKRASTASRVYVTNAVKHFKFEPRGKRRLHKRPNASEIKICRRWLFDEIEVATVHGLIVALGATAAQGLMGRAIPVSANRGASSMWRRTAGSSSPSIRPRCYVCKTKKRSVLLTRVSSMTCARLSDWPRPDNTTAEPPFPRGARGCKP